MQKLKVLSVFGTRPEAIKMCPLVKELEDCPAIDSFVCLTGQHREMLQQVIDRFGTKVDYSLDIMRPDQTLFTITAAIVEKIAKPLQELRPDIVLVHGDTTTSFAAALAAFYCRIPVGHVEAGLRTGDRYSPFPEEMNRTLTARIAELHFAPTLQSRENLYRENIRQHVYVTGNTVIDAFRTTFQPNYQFRNPVLVDFTFENRRTILFTAHRRENLDRLEDIFRAVILLHDRFPDVQFVYPVHLNPQVQEPARRLLGNCERIHLLEPLDVMDMHNLIARSYLVMTDSGGLQEEAPHCGVPVLVLRTETERPEAIEAGTVRIAGTHTDAIVREATRLLTDPELYRTMSHAINPYGDGHASQRIIRALLEWNRQRGSE